MHNKIYKALRKLIRRHIMGCYHFGPYDYMIGKDRLTRNLSQITAKAAGNSVFAKEVNESLPPFYLMGSDKYLDMITSCVLSIYYNAGLNPKIYLMEDKVGFTIDALREYNLLQKNIHVVKKEDAFDHVTSRLPKSKYPTLWLIRNSNILMRKFIDLNLLSSGWKIFVDADTLFFDTPTLALDYVRDGVSFSQLDLGGDGKPFLSFPENDILEVTGLTELKAGCCNSGFIHVNSDDIDWEYMERVLTILIDKQGGLNNIVGPRFHVIEQVIYAILFSHVGKFAYLPKKEFPVLPKYNKLKNPIHPFNHYIGTSRRFFAYNAVNNVFIQNGLIEHHTVAKYLNESK